MSAHAMALLEIMFDRGPEAPLAHERVLLRKSGPARVIFLKIMDSCTPDLFRHTEAPDQLRVGDEEFVPLVRKCFWRWLSHSLTPTTWRPARSTPRMARASDLKGRARVITPSSSLWSAPSLCRAERRERLSLS
jgi:hypothetical protein